jgi:tetratricopeptide (TPR) repeat protein
MAADQLPADEQQTKEELLFALHHRDKPTLAFVECKSTAKRDELAEFLQRELAEYAFYTIDLTPLTVASLLRTLDEELPATIKNSPPVTYVVNVHGLENRLDEQLAAQLNLERELLFRNVPYITLIWADAYFFRKLQRLAPDLWHWVTYKFRFDDPTVQPLETLPPLPPQRLPQKGDIAERRERIHTLEERYSHLDLSEDNKLRLLRDKLTIKTLLAAEYREAFEFSKSIGAYREALGLDEQIQAAVLREDNKTQDTHQRGALLFSLGWIYFHVRLFAESLVVYNESRALLPNNMQGMIDHQIGSVYSEQQQWALALESYTKALKWHEQTESFFDLGKTYHQIGMMYAAQEQWVNALENYEQALKWKKKTANNLRLGSTYHQIGIMYAAQEQWALALENYKQSLEWDQRTGDTFGLSSTYHQIGMAYAEQQHWEAALENYEHSLKWKQQVGDTYELPGTYYQIGRLYEAQGKLTAALSWFEKAVASAANHPNLPMAEESLARVQEKLSNQPTT